MAIVIQQAEGRQRPRLWDNINFIMEKQWLTRLGFLEQLQPTQEQQRISSVPLNFEYLPVEIISKEFTKLNSTHPFRIHYLGPRPNDTLAFHKKFGTQYHQQPTHNQSQPLPYAHSRYKLNLQKIMACGSPGKRDQHYKTTFFYRAFEGMNPTLKQEDEFIFNGSFQSGNLDCVIKVQPLEFDLFLRIDSNTKGHTGWYFFSIKNGQKKQRLTLNICNMKKKLPLYEQGLKPYVFSRKLYQKEGKNWSQAGQNCTFAQSTLRYSIIYERTSPSSLFQLSFQYEFVQQDDEVFFAYCVPYTYSELQKDIELYRSSPFVKELCLERSLSGLSIPLLHITDHSAEPEVQSRKKCMVITGRVHPAQTNGSHMVRGFIEGLLGNSKESERLRQQAHVFIVPMLNPDGVVLGNTRTSAVGKDLNRQFIDPDPSLYPQCYHLKQFVTKLQKRSEVIFYFDFHGHSQRKNTFLYGPNYLLQHSEYLRCRLLPRMIENIEPTFRYYSCNFVIPEDKRSTARAVMLSQLKIPYVYTVESSIGLFYHTEMMKTLPLNSDYWYVMGLKICHGASTFNSLLIQFQLISKERMLDRGKNKQRSISSSGSRLSKKNAEDQFQQFVRCKKNTESSPLIYGLLKQIKLSTFTKPLLENNSEGNSDDHDLQEDLPSLQLKELCSQIQRQRLKYKEHNKICVEDDIDIIIPKISTDKIEEICNSEKIAINGIKIRKSSQRLTKQTSLSKGTPIPHRETQTLDIQSKSKGFRNTKQSIINSRKSVQSAGYTHSHSRQLLKPAHFHKPRYSLATKNLFPVQNKEEVLSLPKSLQVMRRQMKKGRLLISNLEESRMKFVKGTCTDEGCREERRERKGPFNPVDPMKVRMVRRSSSSQVAYQGNEKATEQPFMISATYNSLQGLEVDNLAMTIKAYKRR